VSSGSSPRVLLYLFGSKDNLVRALPDRARSDQLAAVEAYKESDSPDDLIDSAHQVWQWLSAPAHRRLLGLWVEVYARSLVDPAGRRYTEMARHGQATLADRLALPRLPNPGR
jgi:hypothetical protein